MEIIDVNKKVKCEMGACRERADYAVKLDRVGIRGRIYICDKCLHELYGAIGAKIVPKSVETAKAKGKRK